MKKRIIIYCGMSSSGKTYLSKKYLKEHKDSQLIVTYTTRPMRPNEIDGIDYHFISDDTFDVLKLMNKLIEQREYNTTSGLWRYGTGWFINDWDNEFVGVFDLTGIEAICKAYPRAEVIVNYVYVSESIRKKRAIKRGGFDEAEWERRLKTDEEDFSDEKLTKLNDVLRQYGNPPITEIKNF